MRLPLEVLHEIFKPFEKFTLKIFRLVCKLFEKAASHLLVNQVIISNNYVSLKLAKAIVTNFQSAVRTIVYCPVFYQALNKDQFFSKSRLWFWRPQDRVDQHLKHAYKVYCRLASQQRQIAQSGKCFKTLRFAIATAANARKLTFSAPREPGKRQTSDVLRYGLRNEMPCKLARCSLQPVDHLNLFLHPEPLERLLLDDFWYPAIVALSASKSRISEIDMDTSQGSNRESFMPIKAFDATKHQFAYVKDRFRMFTKLHLEIGIDPTDTEEKDCLERGDVAKVLSTAVHLKSLYLCASQSPEDYTRIYTGYRENAYNLENVFTAFGTFLGGCQFPRLRTLILQSFIVSESDLLRLLQGSPDLENLILSVFRLSSGSWWSVADRTKDTLPSLKTVRLQYLSGFGHADPQSKVFLSHRYAINDYFFHDGNNPFKVYDPRIWQGYTIDGTDNAFDDYFFWNGRWRVLDNQYYRQNPGSYGD